MKPRRVLYRVPAIYDYASWIDYHDRANIKYLAVERLVLEHLQAEMPSVAITFMRKISGKDLKEVA
jgi:hypothetical protein